MPIYQYHCASCGADLEIFQRMTEASLTVCPECQGELRKVFSPVGIVFKGSGFYATDSKKSSTAGVPPVTADAGSTPAKTAPATETAAAPASPGTSATTATPGTSAATPAAT